MSVFSRLLSIRQGAAKHRVPLLIVGGALFFAGLAWSVAQIDLDASAIAPRLVLAAIALTALGVLANAGEQWFAARSLRLPYGYGRALKVSCVATLANILPLPGGLLVRGASFSASGASKAESATVLGVSAAIWVLLTIALVGFAALPGSAMIVLASLCLAGAVVLTAWTAYKFDAVSAIGMLVSRCALIAITVLRLLVILQMLSVEGRLREAAVYSGASLVGQIVGIVPSGIGVVETVGAGLALAIDAAPEAAFLALSLNRILGLAVAGLVVFFWVSPEKDAVSAKEL
ncbi:MAG: hypothetical protein SXU28_05670 [Pseudomonadota bacterium]|nr:hypothetical protein [Pseudomonadota bacterium]